MANGPRVVYLIGAGGSQACISSIGSPHKLLMKDLVAPLSERLNELIVNNVPEDNGIKYLVNSVMDGTTNVEQVITFLEDAPSVRHRELADIMRTAFEDVLRATLDLIAQDAGADAVRLYKVLLDLHNISDYPETLRGIITTNYDEYLEAAIEEVYSDAVDFGIQVDPPPLAKVKFPLVKLHGSFGWEDSWPIQRNPGSGHTTLWIPPGIYKDKRNYPFNVLWGLARELLSCDLLRVVGFSLGPNDWDLISLLFASRHLNSSKPLSIEIIDAPLQAHNLKKTFPYLELSSMLESEPIGSQLISELTGRPSPPFAELSNDDQQNLIEALGWDQNWFEVWLIARVETLFVDLGTVSTSSGIVQQFFENV